MKFRKKQPRYLSMDSTMREVFLFACSSVDGLITIFVSFFSFIFACLFALDLIPNNRVVVYQFLFFVPILLPFFFIRARKDTYSDDRFAAACHVLVMLVVLSIPFNVSIGELLCQLKAYVSF